MNKSLKVTLYTLLGVIVTLLIVVSVALYLVFTPERLTPIVRSQASKQLTCEMKLDNVELTFFSTFPHFGLKMHHFQLINPIEGAPCDTLVSMESLTVTLDLMAYLKQDAIVVNEFQLLNPKVCVYVDSLGKANYDIVPSSEPDTASQESSNFVLNTLDINTVLFKHANIRYIDQLAGTKASIKDFNMNVSGSYLASNGDANIGIEIGSIVLEQQDSLPLNVNLKDVEFGIQGTILQDNFKGNLNLLLSSMSVEQGKDALLDKVKIGFNSDFAITDLKTLALENTNLFLNDFKVKLSGSVSQETADKLALDINYASDASWDIAQLLNLVPKSMSSDIKGLKMKGGLAFQGKVEGVYKDSIMPLITTYVQLYDGMVDYPDLPYRLTKMSTQLETSVDLNGVSNLIIHDFKVQAGKNKVALQGKVTDFLNQVYCDLNMNTYVDLYDINRTVKPMGKQLTMAGRVSGKTHATFYVDDVVNERYTKMHVTSSQKITSLDVLYNDTIAVKMPSASLSMKMPSATKGGSFKEWLQLMVKADLNASMKGTGDFNMKGVDLNIGVGNFVQTKKALSMRVDYALESVAAHMDSMDISVLKPKGRVKMTPSRYASREYRFDVSYSNTSLGVVQPDMRLLTEFIDATIQSEYDPHQKNDIAKLRPSMTMRFNNGLVAMKDLSSFIHIPTIQFDLTPTEMVIKDSRVKIDESDFSLKGTVSHIQDYLNKEGLLVADFDFISNTTNVTQLMGMVSGAGSASASSAPQAEAQSLEEGSKSKEELAASVDDADPFMVPLGVDVTLRTKIKQALYDGSEINDVKGTLICKDGTLVLEQMGFTNKAAEMQLTGIYRSRRRNHLFVGMDFHLLNVDVHELIQMIPDVDTVIPMLAEFDGRGEFHFGIEANLKANYELKYSTLRGAAAFEGKDLVLLDSETFGTISKYLMLSKSTVNKIDSLDVQMTFYKKEIDLYPFQIAMGKYKAVIEGRHTLDNNCNYKISITQTPLPVRLALEIKGPMDDLKFNMIPCRYKNLYNPAKRNETEKQTLYFKKMISDALKRNVK